MELLRRRRRALSTILALVLAVESVAVVLAATGSALTRPSAAHPLPDATPAGEVLAEAGSADDTSRTTSTDAASVTGPTATSVAAVPAAPDAPDFMQPKGASAASPATPKVRHEPASRPAAPVAPVSRSAATTTRATASTTHSAAVFKGRNHVWIPSLGISRPVSFFPCDRAAPPDNYVYRWGCAGTNNVYLLGHASSVFRPLHDAYVSGRLHAGMTVYYADGSGRVHRYAVKYWKLVRPTGDVGWAWAAQSVPSMTLQTCVGSNSQYRLIVRLVQVG